MPKCVTSWLKYVGLLGVGMVSIVLFTACATPPLLTPPPTISPDEWSKKYAPAPRHLPELEIHDSYQSAPAGSDVIYQFKSYAVSYYRKYQFGVQGLSAGITSTVFQSAVPWEGELLLRTATTISPGLYTAQISVYTTDYDITITRPISLEVTACSESPSGHFIQRLDELNEIRADKLWDTAQGGEVIPIQICGRHPSRHITVTLESIYAGSAIVLPELLPRRLYRSYVYPVPRIIALHNPSLIGGNVSLVAETDTELQMGADVTPGLYLLVFVTEHLPWYRPSPTLTYDLELTP